MKKLNKHDYSGFCAPAAPGRYPAATFSVGIFKWILKANGKGLKKSAVIFRVKGLCSCSEKVYETAKKYCEKLDDGWVPNKKSMSVK